MQHNAWTWAETLSASFHMHEEAGRRILNWTAFAFSLLVSPSAELSGLHILSWMKGELSLCITMTFRPHSFSHCLTVFGQQMHPHRGVAAPSLHPQSQHAAPHKSPNKRERRVGPSCASCGPWTFEECWEIFPVHLNYIMKRLKRSSQTVHFCTNMYAVNTSLHSGSCQVQQELLWSLESGVI